MSKEVRDIGYALGVKAFEEGMPKVLPYDLDEGWHAGWKAAWERAVWNNMTNTEALPVVELKANPMDNKP